MAHERDRRFNTAKTYPEQSLDNDLCHSNFTRGGHAVWMRGQCPMEVVATAGDIYKPRLDDYVRRALDPATAPSYGVLGDA